ncbi:MAG: S-adenosylmethionine:tRNA ribosyltransferase-isomerase [Jatrophihabitans sp.]
MTALTVGPSTRFELPDGRTAAEPPERRGLGRDGVRLLVAGPAGVSHHRFHELPAMLRAGDLVVVNTSRTVAAELTGIGADGWPVVLHVATALDDGSWVIELRTAPDAAEPILTAQAGAAFVLGARGGVRLELIAPYPPADQPGDRSPTGRGSRLWRAVIDSPIPFTDYLAGSARPISYGYLSRHWPLSNYQTVFGTDPGSAEMPSAGRPFTDRLVTRLVSAGIGIAPITLHTGVSSQQAGEGPQPERFVVAPNTARLVNQTRRAGGRVIAVGTTVARALESAADAESTVSPTAGWTTLVIGPQHPARVVDGLITGLHGPDASHLLLVESVAGTRLAQQAYDAAVAGDYLWHEFGDSCLLLPS